MHPNQQDSAQKTWESRLCPACGLCCNGVLFRDVELTKADSTLALQEAGLRLRKLKGKPGFTQPCSCFDGRFCTAYEHRPIRCKSFDCHTLKQLKAGSIDEATALKRIRKAQIRVRKVEALLRSQGNHDELLPLTARYRSVMRQPIDLSQGEEGVETRAELMLQVNDLMHQLHREFLSRGDVEE